MATQTLTTFFRKKQEHAGGTEIDWEKRKHEWLAAIGNLYDMIVDNFLAKSIADSVVQVDYRPKTITEDFLGTYEVRELVLRVGDEAVVFSPKGRNIVGATGRVDIQGEMGGATLVLQPESRWALVAQRVPTLRIVPLTENSLLSALKEVMRP